MMEKLTVYPEQMAANVENLGGVVHSGEILLALARAGILREDAYRIVQRSAMATWSTLGKPEQYVMIALHSSDILFGGQADAAAFADVRSIGGLDSETNARLAREVSQILHQALGIPPARVFLNFTNVEAGNWGWNGDTFG